MTAKNALGAGDEAQGGNASWGAHAERQHQDQTQAGGVTHFAIHSKPVMRVVKCPTGWYQRYVERKTRQVKQSFISRRLLWVPAVLLLAVSASAQVTVVEEISPSPAITNAATPVTEPSTNFLKQLKPFILKDLSGNEVKYSESFKGKMLMLFFFTTWAQPCQDQVPALVELQKQYGGKDFSVVGISLDERAGRELKLFVQRNKVNFPILLADLLVVQDVGGIAAVPTLALVDQNRMMIMKEAAVTDQATLVEILKTVRQNQK